MQMSIGLILQLMRQQTNGSVWERLTPSCGHSLCPKIKSGPANHCSKRELQLLHQEPKMVKQREIRHRKTPKVRFLEWKDQAQKVMSIHSTLGFTSLRATQWRILPLTTIRTMFVLCLFPPGRSDIGTILLRHPLLHRLPPFPRHQPMKLRHFCLTLPPPTHDLRGLVQPLL